MFTIGEGKHAIIFDFFSVKKEYDPSHHYMNQNGPELLKNQMSF